MNSQLGMMRKEVVMDYFEIYAIIFMEETTES
jgi:hypothetical protein